MKVDKVTPEIKQRAKKKKFAIVQVAIDRQFEKDGSKKTSLAITGAMPPKDAKELVLFLMELVKDNKW